MPYDHVLGFITCAEKIAESIQEANNLPEALARNDPRVFEFERNMLNVRVNRDGYLYAACGKAEETSNGLEEGRYYTVLVLEEGRKVRLEASLDTWRTRLNDATKCLKERHLKARTEDREESTSGGDQEAAGDTEIPNEDSDEENYRITYVDETIACYVYLGMLHGPVVLKRLA
ncbi:hypothetical protein BDQ17DRAFT_1434893 [Cyathus striatus]|nr:hypothetical protein BDQ17DRAFT_1434893 [Cyathus striatus]